MDEKKSKNGTEDLLRKRDAIIAEINGLIAKLEHERKARFDALVDGSNLSEYYKLLSHIVRWGKIAAALRCGKKPPEPMAVTITEEEMDLYDRAVSIIKSIQKSKAGD